MSSRRKNLPPRRGWGEGARFLIVGAVATGMDIALFNVLNFQAGTGPLAAKTLSTIAAAIIAFIGNRQWSFSSGKTATLPSQVPFFVAVNLASLAPSLLPLAIARYLFDSDGFVALNVAANGVGLLLATAFRFHAYRRWVFGPQKPRGRAKCR